MILSISNIAWQPNERKGMYAMLQNNGFTGLEIAPGLLFASEADPFNPSDQAIRNVYSELESFNLEIISMQSLLYGKEDALLFGNDKQQKNFFNGIVAAINLAERLHISNIVFGSPLNRNVSKDMDKMIAREIALETFSQLGLLASRAGVSILIEPNPKDYKTNFINSMNEAILFITELQSPGLKAILDIGSIKMNNEFSDLPNLISRSIDHLNHVHVSEPFLKPAPQSIHEFEYLYNLLKANNYNKALSIEMKSQNLDNAKIQRCLSYLSLIDKKYKNEK